VWRLRLASPGALSLNLGFVTCDLPPSAELVVRPTFGGPALRYRAAALVPGAGLWTPVLLTDDLVVELDVAAQERGRVALELARFNRGYRYFGAPAPAKAGACNIDVVCPVADDWRAEIRAVGVYTIAGTWKCSGAMINNTARDARPLFLTANHCGINGTSDASVVLYWNYESPVCGQQGGGSLAQNQAGTTLLANWSGSDFTLLELDDLPDPAWRVTLAGWNRADAVPTASVTIHHPSTDEKSISFDDDPATITSYLADAVPGDGTHLRIGAWELGTTEGGSSGSPLFDPDHRIVGQLHGGYASCSRPDEPDWYGRFFRSWEGGGTPQTRLRDWLDPTAGGAVTLDLLDPLAGLLTVAPTDPVVFTGPVGGPFAPAQQVFSLGNAGVETLAWEAAAASWLDIQPAVGTLGPGAQQQVTVAPGSAAADLGAGSRTTSLVFANTAGGAGGAAVPVRLAVLEARPRLVRVGPNPFRSYTTVIYTVEVATPVRGRVYDVRGRLAADLGTRGAVAGPNDWSWDGRDGKGRRQPGGRYVLELEAGRHRLRIPLTVAH
ncbi:MAG: hypothetical protein IH621_14970, partial [Krumholzibacteria bacterium]|nr:hypothetical protein [Candidatus Krumholzibacteria bacterium]